MSAAQDAWKAAKTAIAKAKRTGAEWLDFSGERFRALETLPPGVSALDKLHSLYLNNTQISDLAPLRRLTGLRRLRLKRRAVN